MKFDFIVGNPPYQDNTVGDQKSFAPPIYHKFMQATYEIGDKVMLITPARFLFGAGATPKDFNRKMLSDPHLKVVWYEIDSGKIFPDTDIKGGIAVTLHDNNKDYGPIETFTSFPELNDILNKVKNRPDFESFEKIVFSRTAYRLTDKMHEDHPEAIHQLSNGHPYDMSTNIFALIPQIFYKEPPIYNGDYVKILGLVKNERTYLWIKSDYINKPKDFYKFKVFCPQANGSGAIGEVLSTPLIGQPLIGQPLIGHTETFMSIGYFDTQEEAEACLKYVKSKFARTMLGILKVTQSNPPEKWKFIPLQDFTPSSDIDWSLSVPEIDRQLYEKYGLSDLEIDFIETHVREMN